MTEAQRDSNFVHVRDVTLRDGLQDESLVATEGKIALFGALVAAGITDLELTSFVRPDRIPALADAEALVKATQDADGITRWGLVLNAKGAERALSSGLTNLQFVVSVSEAHQLENAGRGVEQSLEELREIVKIARSTPTNVAIEVTLATAFGCPFSGQVPVTDVLRVLENVLAAGIDSVSLADTIGVGVPTEVSALVSQVRRVAPHNPVGVHLHDTRGLGIANALAALEAGASRIDGTVGGLGGCPFAPGASGNLPLEDLIHALHAMGMQTGVDLDRLLEAAELACQLVGQPVSSHVGVAGPRFSQRHR
jgi:hydroxymethylglutaryl-CoA lyase